MTKAILLSAGQGRRLLPLTENLPKCMLPVAGKSILQWQLDALLEVGIKDITIVTGFHSDIVEQLLKLNYADETGVKILYNPFFNLSDNLASCWIARSCMHTDFLLINGDTIFESAVPKQVLASPAAPITLTIDRKDRYDQDDMRVELNGLQVKNVSKVLSDEHTHAESIGMLYFRESGPKLFRENIEKAMQVPGGLKAWFLSVIDTLANENLVQACSVSGMRWAEIDFIADLESARKLMSD